VRNERKIMGDTFSFLMYWIAISGNAEDVSLGLSMINSVIK